MLIPLAALPLLAATLDAPAAAPAWPPADAYAASPRRETEAPPAPSIESSPRIPEPALRRTWCAVGTEVARAGPPVAAGRGIGSPAARATVEGRVQRLRTRGPPRRES